MADTLKTLRAALELLDAQWQCSRLWSMEEAQDSPKTLRTLLASMEAQPSEPKAEPARLTDAEIYSVVVSAEAMTPYEFARLVESKIRGDV